MIVYENKELSRRSLTFVSYRARFCKAVTELQITGLIRMPTKRRPDFVQRVAFGLWYEAMQMTFNILSDSFVKSVASVPYVRILQIDFWSFLQ